jgi:outer membrane lipoprotein
MHIASIILLSLLLAACASAPFELKDVDTQLTPNDVMSNPSVAHGKRVMWGGMIVNTRNLQNATEVEILAYPLTSSGAIKKDQAAQRRFLLVKEGYLESADYSRGRYISALGKVEGTRPGKVDEAPYVYPVLRAEQTHLWPVEQPANTEPSIHFGIGVIFGR